MSSFITPHCISAYVIHQASEGVRYLLIRRCGKYLPGTWQMVTGGIETGETASQAAFREIQEETGLTPYALYSADAVETFYMQSNDKINFVPVFVACVKDTNVRLAPKEHDAYEWLSFEEAKERLVWAEQKRVIAHIHDCFVSRQPNNLLAVDLLSISSFQKPIISRTAVYGVAMRDTKLLLIKQQKGPYSGKWDLPGGGIEAGETIEEALRREFREEVGMTFGSMHFYKNATAMTEWVNEYGSPYLFHQIGLIYEVEDVAQMENETTELEYDWVDPKELTETVTSPFAQLFFLKKLEMR